MKKTSWRTLVLGVALVALVVGLAVPALAVTGQKQMNVEYMDIKLTVDGVPVGGLRDANGSRVHPFACEGTTYLPVRAVGEALGKEVKWDGPTRTVYISDPAEPMAMTVNSYYGTSASKQTLNVDYLDIKLVVDGKEVTPKDANGKVVEPFAYNGTTYLPVRAVGEALGKTVRWDGETKTVHLGELPQGTYLVDVCKVSTKYNSLWGLEDSDYFVYRAADHKAFVMSDGKRYSQGLSAKKHCAFELDGKYESITFDVGVWYGNKSNASLFVYLDGELAQTIKVSKDSGVQRVTVPLNYAGTIIFDGGADVGIANAVLNGEREAPAKPVPPANATYLVDVCETYASKYKAAENRYFEDIFANRYTNGIDVSHDKSVILNGRYNTLKATIVCANLSDFTEKATYCFSVDGTVVKEIEVSPAMGPQAIEVPLNYGMKLSIDAGGSCYLADAYLE